MKIALIVPKWTDTLGRYDFLAQLMVVHYPLNVAIVAKYMEKGGNEVEIIDAQIEQLSNSEVAHIIINKGFEVVGYSVTSPLYDAAVEISSMVRKAGCNAVHIAGGAHINFLQKEAYNDNFDYLVFGEAEETVVELLSFIKGENKNLLDSIMGVIYKNREGEIVQNDPRPIIKDIDSIEFQAAHLMNLPAYKICEGVNKKSERYISMMASRGCPYKCVFCAEPLNSRKLRFRSAENIADEIEFHYRNSGVTHFFFVDSCLTLKRKQVMQLCEILIQKRLPVTWSGWTRVDLVDEELFAKMKEAGFIVVSLGIESGDPEVLKIIKKGITIEQIRDAFEVMRKLKIEAFCSAMIGLPGDTRESIWRTIKFIRNLPGVLYSTISMATPYPGTEMQKWVIEGRYGMKLLQAGSKSRSRWDDCSFSVNDMQPRDLIRLQRIGLFWIHFTPRRILFILRMLGFSNAMKAFFNFIGLSRLIKR